MFEPSKLPVRSKLDGIHPMFDAKLPRFSTGVPGGVRVLPPPYYGLTSKYARQQADISPTGSIRTYYKYTPSSYSSPYI